jgi:protein-disulfide isomerase
MNFLPFNRILAECLAYIAILVLPLGLAHGQETAEPDEDALAVLLRLDKVIQPMDLTTTKGVKWSLAEANKAKATVIVFLDFKCPISNRYVPILNSLAERYQGKGVVFAAVICDEEKPEELECVNSERISRYTTIHNILFPRTSSPT